MYLGSVVRGDAFGIVSRVSAKGGEEMAYEPPMIPFDTPVEVEATATGFRVPCVANDPNIPPILLGNPTGFALCDANGNPVIFSKSGSGFVVETQTYTATVNSDGIVTSVRKK